MKVTEMQTSHLSSEQHNAPGPTRIRAQFFCAACNRQVWMLTAEQAAAICECSRRRIYRWIESGLLHFIEQGDGIVLICGRSLKARQSACDNTTVRLLHLPRLLNG